VLPDRGHAPNLDARRAQRILRREPSRDVCGSGLVEVMLYLVADIAIGGCGIDERPDAARKLSPA
jgi:hypothetical protein